MYAYIGGKLITTREGAVVIENNGIGYFINISNNTLTELPKIGSETRLFIYQHVKEDEISLYGFCKEAEKMMFLRLIKISGVGPKLAMSILSGASLKVLSMSILSSDYSTLCKIKGIGKKTAERIILELKEEIGKDNFALGLSDTNVEDTVVADSLEALVALGMNKSEVYESVLRHRRELDTVTDIVRSVLRGMNNG